MKIVVSN